jgi:FkbM family methyltransferase
MRADQVNWMIDGDPHSGLLGLLNETVSSAIGRERSAFDELAGDLSSSIVLFGAGSLGRRTLAILRSVGIEPLAFCDNNVDLWGQSIDGLLVTSPEEAANRYGEIAAFVITIWNGRAEDTMASRKRQLAHLGCRVVSPFGYLYWKYSSAALPRYCLDLPHRVLLQDGLVRKALDLWADELSTREFLNQVAFRLRLDFDCVSQSDSNQYFPKGVFQPSPEEVFVDCGAFTGDTIQNFIRARGDGFESIAAFEPDPLNFRSLEQRLAQLPKQFRDKVRVFPYAAAASNGVVRFAATGTDLSATDQGSSSVPCVRLDDALRQFRPTFVKFDIEGSELDALAGAAELIERNLPVLAVSVYHRQSDLWRIPLFLSALSKEYRLFLRPHAREGWDLVCYAVPRHRLSA